MNDGAAERVWVLHCIDPRLKKPISLFLQSEGIEEDKALQYPPAGGCQDFARPPDDSVLVHFMKQVAIGVKLGASQAILINHTSCLAYGDIFASPEKERERLWGDLVATKKRITDAYPALSVRLYLAVIDETGNVSFETVKVLPRQIVELSTA